MAMLTSHAMHDSPLPLILVLLAASVFVVTLARRLGLPSILGYVTVGLVLGPHALGAVPRVRHHAPAGRTRRGLPAVHAGPGIFLAAHGGAAPRGVRPGCAAGIRHGGAWSRSSRTCSGSQWAQSIVIGGVVAMSSTVLIVQQLTERAELNRTHGRLAFSVVLFQDIAVVPFLALAAALAPGSEEFSYGGGAEPGRRRHRGRAGGAGGGPLAAAAAALRDRQQPAARAVHARGAAGGAGIGLGFADGGPVDGARRIPRGHDAGRDRIQPPGRKRHPAVPRHPARPVLHLRGHAARLRRPVARDLGDPRAARRDGDRQGA